MTYVSRAEIGCGDSDAAGIRLRSEDNKTGGEIIGRLVEYALILPIYECWTFHGTARC